MKIKKAGSFLDVFTGYGWKNHTRVKWNKREGMLQFIKGTHLSPIQVREVMRSIKP